MIKDTTNHLWGLTHECGQRFTIIGKKGWVVKGVYNGSTGNGINHVNLDDAVLWKCHTCGELIKVRWNGTKWLRVYMPARQAVNGLNYA